MSDIDDELLALAGGDVSEDDNDDADRSHSPRRRRHSSSPASDGSYDGRDAPARAPSFKSRATARYDGGAGAGVGAVAEGEASRAPGSPGSEHSVSMDESDSEDDTPMSPPRRGTATATAGDEVEKYPIDGLFMSHAEKAEIMGLREIEREQILADRREENERLRQNRVLRQLVDTGGDGKKRKASLSELEDSIQRQSARSRKWPRTQDKSAAADHESSPRRGRDADRLSWDVDRGGGDDDESEVPSGGRRQQQRPSPSSRDHSEAQIGLNDIERVRVGRSRFLEVCFWPGFDETITGCFVRVNIGPDSTGRDTYRMAVIKGFATGKPYAMETRTGQIVVDTYCKAAHGKSARDWPFISCSDRPFIEAEWNRYKQVCQAEGVPLPKWSFFMSKTDQINHLVTRSWSDLEIQQKINRQNELKVKYGTIERDQLQKATARARAAGNHDRAAQLQAELDRLETPHLAFKTSLSARHTPQVNAASRLQERLAELNEENRRRNAEVVRKAQIMARVRQRAREKKTRVEDAGGASRAASQDVNGGVPGTQPSSDDAPEWPGALPNENGLLPHMQRIQDQQDKEWFEHRGIRTVHRPIYDDEIIAAIDLGDLLRLKVN